MVPTNFLQIWRTLNLENGLVMVSKEPQSPYWSKTSSADALTGRANVYKPGKDGYTLVEVSVDIEVYIPVNRIVYCER